MLEQPRFLEAPVTILGKCRVMRNLLIKPETREPAPRQMHAQLLDQLAFAADAVQIADQQHAQQQLWIDGWTTRVAIAVLKLVMNKTEVNVLVNRSQQMVLWNLLFQAEVVEQRFRAGVPTHHERQSSGNDGPNNMVTLCR